MDVKLRKDIVDQERRKLLVLKRIATDPKFDEDVHERAAMYAVALEGYIASMVLLTHQQAIFEDSFQWANNRATMGGAH